MERLSPAASHASATPAYEHHRPEETIHYGVVHSELKSFLARGRDSPPTATMPGNTAQPGGSGEEP